jgi:hypothetical protein
MNNLIKDIQSCFFEKTISNEFGMFIERKYQTNASETTSNKHKESERGKIDVILLFTKNSLYIAKTMLILA